MRTKIVSISILALLLFGLLACFTASAANITISATDPLAGEVGVLPDSSFVAHANITQAKGHPMMMRGGTNRTGVFVWGNWVGPSTNTTINFPFNASLNNHKYYWTIWANDSYGNSSNTTFSFTTEGADPNVSITYPVDGSTISTFTHISGTCGNASSVLAVILFDFTNLSYWNWAAGNWSLADLNTSFTSPIGVTSWIVSIDIPTLAEGHSYGVAVYGNNSYNTDYDSVGFTYETHPSAQVGAMGLIAKIVLELVLLFVALGMVYMLVTNWMNKPKHTVKDTMEMFRTLVIAMVILGVAAVLIAAF